MNEREKKRLFKRLRDLLNDRFPDRESARRAIGCQSSQFSDFMNGKKGLGITYLTRACQVCGTTIESLMKGEEIEFGSVGVPISGSVQHKTGTDRVIVNRYASRKKTITLPRSLMIRALIHMDSEIESLLSIIDLSPYYIHSDYLIVEKLNSFSDVKNQDILWVEVENQETLVKYEKEKGILTRLDREPGLFSENEAQLIGRIAMLIRWS